MVSEFRESISSKLIVIKFVTTVSTKTFSNGTSFYAFIACEVSGPSQAQQSTTFEEYLKYKKYTDLEFKRRSTTTFLQFRRISTQRRDI